MSTAAGFNEDFLDILHALDAANADYIVVGAYAMALHGVPRATGDLDILIRADSENASRILEALEAFGAPIGAHGLTRDDLETTGNVYQIGLPPRRIDLLTSISGLSFEEAWASRELITVEEISVPFLGREALLRNKRASGREKDLLDLHLLGSD